MMLIAVLVINTAYFFKDDFRSLSQLHFDSKTFKSLAATPFINKVPIPLPSNYIIAQDLLQYHTEIGAGTLESTYPGVFLNGEHKWKGGFWYYYLYVGLLKTPISILILILAGLTTASLRLPRFDFLQKYFWFAFPALFFFMVLSFFNNFQVGLRHILIIYPMLFIGIAALIHYWEKRFRYTAIVTVVLFVSMIISISRFPDLIAYTSEIVFDKKSIYKKIRDASLDYGENVPLRVQYLKDHPDIKIPDKIPAAGRYIVRSIELLDEGPYATKPKYLWLLNFEPVDHYRYSLFIYDISEQDVSNLKQKSRPQ